MNLGFAVVAVFGTVLPLLLLVYGLRGQRVAVVLLAFNVALGVNLVFVAHAVRA